MKKNFLIYLVFILFFVVVPADTVFSYETVYTYDDLNRLTSATYNDGTGSKTFIYHYDAAGNMTRRSISDTSSNLLNMAVVNPNPDNLNASWTLTGPNGYSLVGIGDQTINDLTPGAYMITWGSVTNWVTPSSETITLLAGGSITFTGAYQLIPVVPSPPTTGVVGGDITLNGMHFGAIQGSSYVDFNGVHGTIVFWSDTHIVVTVPPGATSGCLKIVSDYGESGCINFTVITDSLYATFTGAGVWQWNGATWNQLNAQDPANMAAAGSYLYATFTGAGVWQWDGTTWNQLNAQDPANMAAADPSLYATFTGAGVWQWDGTTWSQLNAQDPANMAASGSYLYATFTGHGVWQWNGTTWNQLNAQDPANMAAAGSYLYSTFTGAGVWQWNGTTWNQLNAQDPANMAAAGSYLYSTFTGAGVWQWDGTTWNQLNAQDPANMAAGD